MPYNPTGMPFTVRDFQALLRLLERQPGWRDALRAALLGEEFAELPKLVRDLVRAQQATNRQIRLLAQAQARTEEQVASLQEAVRQLTEAQARTEQQVAGLQEAVRQLTEAQARTEERVGRLEDRVDRLEGVVERLAEAQARTEEELRALVREVAVLKGDVADLKDDVSDLKGSDLERTYREQAAQYFQGILRRIRVVDHQRLADLLDDAVDAGRITAAEKARVLECDVVLLGRRDGEQVYLLAEVSSVVDRGDVERAHLRAAILEKATGVQAVAAAAGRHATKGAREEATASGVWLVLDGVAQQPPQPGQDPGGHTG